MSTPLTTLRAAPLHHLALAALVALGACGERVEPRTRHSVLLVTIDTLRADRLGCTGHASARTPRLDALAKSGQLYTQAVAPTPLTLPSHSTLLSGLLPLEHGARDNKPFRFPSERFDTVASSLRARGYQTMAVIGGEPLAKGCGLEAGFDRYDDAFPRALAGSARLGERTADAVTDAALAALDARDGTRPFFLWTHYFDPHDPYVPPSDLAALFADAPYDGEIAFVDRELGRLLDGIEARGLAQDLIVVITADHGESLGEHGEERHGFFVYDATIRVPLIAAGPGLVPARIDDQVRLQDVRAWIEALTAADRVDLAAPAHRGEPAVIESLYGQLHCEFAQLRGLRHPNGSKYLEAAREEWYRWREDPKEVRDLLAAPVAVDPTELDAARAALDDVLRRARTLSVGEGIGEVGYLGAASSPGALRTRSRTDNARAVSPRDREGSIRALIEGVRLLEFGQPLAAAAILGDASTADPDNPALALSWARALRKVAEQRRDVAALDQAITALERVRTLRPGLVLARDLLLFARFQRGDFAGAKALYDAAVTDGSATAATFEAMARARLDLAEDRARSFASEPNPLLDEDAAFADLERAVALGPSPSLIALLNTLETRYSERGRTLQADRIRRIRSATDRDGR